MKFQIKNKIFILPILLIGVIFGYFLNHFSDLKEVVADDLFFSEQTATVRAIQKVSPSVVNIAVYKKDININLNTGKTTEEKVKKGLGTGFIISNDGYLVTNKHVIEFGEEENLEYNIILDQGKSYEAKLIDKDPVNDLAILKIDADNLPFVELGDSEKVQVGSSVIVIGNAMGRYQNSVTKGIISGLGRSIVASDKVGNSESLDNIIQTDAEINIGNSGGPMIDLHGKVIGISVAMDQTADSIGFAIPINDVKSVIQSAKNYGRIIRPKLGLRYIMVNPQIVEERNLFRGNGALIIPGSDGSAAILPDSPAEEAGLGAGDIIFEINAIPIEGKNTLISVIQKYKPGDKIGMKIQRGDRVIMRILELDEF